MSVINTQFWSTLVHFVHDYSPFWRPRAISMIDNSRGAFACLSSTLTVLANSDAIRGLLLKFWGSRSDFHDLRTPWCLFVSVNDTHNFGQFLVRLVHYYSPFRRPRAISTIYKPRSAFACLSSTLTVLANSDAIRGLLFSI